MIEQVNLSQSYQEALAAIPYFAENDHVMSFYISDSVRQRYKAYQQAYSSHTNTGVCRPKELRQYVLVLPAL